jgi:hypothetical protein
VPAAAKLSGPVVYVRSGGFAGVVERLTVRPDGRATLRLRSAVRHGRATDTRVRTLTRHLRGFGSIPADSRARHPIADGFTYSITYARHTVRTDQGAVPAALRPALDDLSAIGSSLGR